MFFFKNLYFQAKQIPNSFFSTRAFNYYKLKCRECLCIAHELRVKFFNFDTNYLNYLKFEIDLAFK